MKMTVAEKMRELTNGSRKAKEEKSAKNHKSYVMHIINTKVRKSASKGNSKAMFKVKKHYVPTLVANAFADKGFNVIRASKNGREFFTVSW